MTVLCIVLHCVMISSVSFVFVYLIVLCYNTEFFCLCSVRVTVLEVVVSCTVGVYLCV